MAIKRACSWQATIKTPESPDNYSSMLLQFQQKQRNILSKTEADLTIDGDYVVVNLVQEETALFSAGVPCFMQLRCYSSPTDAPGSAIWKIDVQDALNDQILGGA